MLSTSELKTSKSFKGDVQPLQSIKAEKDSGGLKITSQPTNTIKMDTYVEVQSPTKKEYKLELDPSECYTLEHVYSTQEKRLT